MASVIEAVLMWILSWPDSDSSVDESLDMIVSGAGWDGGGELGC